MRTFTTIVAAIVASAVLAPIVLIARLLGVRDGHGSVYARCSQLWAKIVLFAAGARVRVHGREHMAKGTGAVYISNHVSWFDMISLAGTIPRCSFVAKRELSRIPIFGSGAKAVGIVFIDRDSRKTVFESYERAARHVTEGLSIVVCPEGTRGSDYRLQPFKTGPFVLAIASQSRVVPTVVYGAAEVMHKSGFRVHAGTIDIHFLPPISTAGMAYDDRAALSSTVWHVMAEALKRQHRIESVTRAAPAVRQ